MIGWAALAAALTVLVLPPRVRSPATWAPGVGRPSGPPLWAGQSRLPAVVGRDRSGPPAAQVAAALDLMALALSSGCSLVEAAQLVAGGRLGRAGDELGRVVAGVRWGLPWAQAWGLASSAWAPARAALVVAETAGIGPALALQRVAQDMRERQARQLELAAARLGVRLVLPLGLAFLPAFVLLAVVPLVAALARDLLVLG